MVIPSLVLIRAERAEHGGQGRDRTADLRVMNPPLSPTELPGQNLRKIFDYK